MLMLTRADPGVVYWLLNVMFYCSSLYIMHKGALKVEVKSAQEYALRHS